MKIFDFAMQMEQEGGALYRECASKSLDEGLTNVFLWLAKQENEHYDIFRKMKQGNALVEVEKAQFKEVMKEFRDVIERKESLHTEPTQIDIYHKALAVEKKSVDFYTEQEQAVEDVKSKEVLLQILAEEKKHYMVVENIIEIVTSPETWTESAEFSHMGEEY